MSNSPTCLKQADFLAAGADDFGTTVADGPVDDPRADCVHPLDITQIDGDRVVQRIDLTQSGGGAGDGECTGDPVNRAVALIAVLLRNLGHVRRIDARNGSEGQVTSEGRPFPADCGPIMRGC